MAEKEIKEEEKITLCPSCGLCPEITIDRKEQKVVFYEDGKEFILTKEAWNELVKLIKEGKLKEI
jgi:hypothetical protein